MRKSAILMTASVLLLGAVSCSEKKAEEPEKKAEETEESK